MNNSQITSRCGKPAWMVACLSLSFLVTGCNKSLPDAPPPMDLEAEKEIVKKNIEAEIAYIMSNPRLTDKQKEEKVKEVKQGGEGYLKQFAESKKVRDQEYGVAQ